MALLTSFAEGERPVYNLRINNLSDRNFLKDGIWVRDFDDLTVEPTDDKMTVESLQITLARGNRAIKISNVKSNKFNLSQYKRIARSGDRIVIEIRMKNKGDDIQSVLVTFPVV